MHPVDVARSLSAQWPCRDLQVRQLASLLHVSISRRSPGSPQPTGIRLNSFLLIFANYEILR